MMEPVNKEASPKDNFRSVRILCLAFIAGAAIFAVIIVVLNLATGPVMPEDGQDAKPIFIGIAAGIAILCFLRAFRIYSAKITGIKNSSVPLNDKLNQYRLVLILYMALCEGPALFSIIIFFLFGDYAILTITGFLLVAMLFRMPQKGKLTTELGLNFQEQQELE